VERESIEKELREDWFKDHVAEFEKLNDRVATLDWYKPNTCCYYTRYVFDGCKLYVSGDIGEAVFCLTEKADIKSIINYDVHYFHGKLSAFDDDKYSFDSATAIARINEQIEYCKENKDYNDEGEELGTDHNNEINDYIETLEELIDVSTNCCNRNNWKYEVEQVYDRLTDYDSDVYEWIFDAGNVIPRSIQAYLIGLKMAYEQLKEKAA
jgi:hypothetical protein